MFREENRDYFYCPDQEAVYFIEETAWYRGPYYYASRDIFLSNNLASRINLLIQQWLKDYEKKLSFKELNICLIIM